MVHTYMCMYMYDCTQCSSTHVVCPMKERMMVLSRGRSPDVPQCRDQIPEKRTKKTLQSMLSMQQLTLQTNIQHNGETPGKHAPNYYGAQENSFQTSVSMDSFYNTPHKHSCFVLFTVGASSSFHPKCRFISGQRWSFLIQKVCLTFKQHSSITSKPNLQIFRHVTDTQL